MSTAPPIRHGELCKLLDVAPRQLSYLLERGFLPQGVTPQPQTGNPRDFDFGQAYWLAIALKLKAFGLKTSLAAEVADYATQAVRGVSQNLGWDFPFCPQVGRFDTTHLYFVDIADLKWIRLVTDANPSREGLEEFEWKSLKKRCPVPDDLRPGVILRLDLGQIASQLKPWEASSVARSE